VLELETRKQWPELGAQVRKREKSTSVVFWKFFDEEEEGEASEDERRNHKGVMVRAYHVFNAAQVEGYEMPGTPRLPETERIARADAVRKVDALRLGYITGSLPATLLRPGSRAL
jgi:antirestriction protein ArdC